MTILNKLFRSLGQKNIDIKTFRSLFKLTRSVKIYIKNNNRTTLLHWEFKYNCASFAQSFSAGTQSLSRPKSRWRSAKLVNIRSSCRYVHRRNIYNYGDTIRCISPRINVCMYVFVRIVVDRTRMTLMALVSRSFKVVGDGNR